MDEEHEQVVDNYMTNLWITREEVVNFMEPHVSQYSIHKVIHRFLTKKSAIYPTYPMQSGSTIKNNNNFIKVN